MTIFTVILEDICRKSLNTIFNKYIIQEDITKISYKQCNNHIHNLYNEIKKLNKSKNKTLSSNFSIRKMEKYILQHCKIPNTLYKKNLELSIKIINDNSQLLYNHIISHLKNLSTDNPNIGIQNRLLILQNAISINIINNILINTFTYFNYNQNYDIQDDTMIKYIDKDLLINVFTLQFISYLYNLHPDVCHTLELTYIIYPVSYTYLFYVIYIFFIISICILFNLFYYKLRQS